MSVGKNGTSVTEASADALPAVVPSDARVPHPGGDDGYVLETSLPYLLNRVGVRLGRLFERHTREHGLSVPMYRVLAYLLHNRTSGLSELSAGVSIDPSTLSRMIGALSDAKHVSRRRRRGDQRSVAISLTEQGRTVVEALVPHARAFEASIDRSIGDEAHTLLKEQLTRIYAGLDELDPDNAPIA